MNALVQRRSHIDAACGTTSPVAPVPGTPAWREIACIQARLVDSRRSVHRPCAPVLPKLRERLEDRQYRRPRPAPGVPREGVGASRLLTLNVVATFAVGGRGPDFLDQCRAGGLDRHAREHRWRHTKGANTVTCVRVAEGGRNRCARAGPVEPCPGDVLRSSAGR